MEKEEPSQERGGEIARAVTSGWEEGMGPSVE